MSLKIARKIVRYKSAFTLVEVILASSLFVVVGMIAVGVFVNILRIQQRVSLENAIYEDARFMMERMAREIRKTTIDYEEYYNKIVERQPYGSEYGCYATRFYNPGNGGPQGSNGNFGSTCNDGSDPASNPGCVIDKKSLDINTGQNPYIGNKFNGQAQDATAFCDRQFGGAGASGAGGSSCSGTNLNLHDELYLIDAKGDWKTFFALKETSAPGAGASGAGTGAEHGLAILRLSGEDNDHDGKAETWTACKTDPANKLCCSKEFDCSNLPTPPPGSGVLENTLSFNAANNFQGFIAISPSRTDVTAVKFYVAPLEDPHKAFAETTAGISEQPHVTIVLTVQPSKSVLQNFSGVVPSITLQTTITSRVYNEVSSYFGKGVCKSY